MIGLKDLLKRVDVLQVQGNQFLDVTGLAYDSRQVQPGNIFICIKGFQSDGHNYICDAYRRGAIGIVVEQPVDVIEGLTVIQVPDSRVALAQLAVQFYNYPSEKLGLIGITGTNGKTTTAHLIESILKEAGQKTGMIGTIANRIGDQNFEVEHTTPESLDLQKLLNQMVEKNVDWTVMEVSSHALFLQRVAETYYDLAVFTNLTQDHLDFHGDLDSYLQAKLKLFSTLNNGPKAKLAKAVINLDDPFGQAFVQAAGDREIFSYGIRQPARVKAEQVELCNKGISFRLVCEQWTEKVNLSTPGLFSVYNALAAASAGLALGISKEKIVRGIEKVQGVPGRFEPVNCGQRFTVIVDYAHTPDGLENVLQTAKQFAKGKIIVVFGCGGDRDKTKRPRMGEIAVRLADQCIITSDNPRSEDPLKIIEYILSGIKHLEGVSGSYQVIPDRREAIFFAVSKAQENDVVIIAGKGHENYQILQDRTIHFDDRETVREALGGGKK